ncbi:hypothetical protein RB195_021850 [Necator americanus]|uniref:Metalloendopeptidase n=1 Tax=Necator americanus TaxID=51031 RepID=A0ABR1ECV6_NECAM
MSRLYDENQDFIMDGQYNGDYAMCSVDRHMEAQNGFIKRQPVTYGQISTLMRMDGLPPYVVVNTDINMEWTKAIYKLYYDKSIPDEETLLNVVDFHRSRTLGNFDHKHVNDSAMYAANRFEGDIGRADRDDHIIINWSNVESGLQDQFDKYSLQMIDHLNTVYDYGSVMHYASTAFSKNGKPTIEPRKKGAEIGQRTGFSDIDLYKINKLYNCPQAETTSSPLPETKTDMKSEARASVKTDKKGPTGSGSVAGSASTSEKSSLISVLTKVACTDNQKMPKREGDGYHGVGSVRWSLNTVKLGETGPTASNSCPGAT